MDPDEYSRFTHELVENLSADDRVVGVVALGSMAGTDRAPDEWSDHDFWIITRNGEADRLRSETDWLPQSTEVVIDFAETSHGRSVIYRNGHLAEYAVFDDRDLELAKANVFRVLYDHCSLQERMQALVGRTANETAEHDVTGAERTGVFLSQITIGVTRYGRGELLSANHLIRGWASRSLASLLASFIVPANENASDSLDPNRRFELAYPVLAAEISAALDSPLLDCARSLLTVAERELAGRVPSMNSAAIGAVRGTVDRAQAVDQ